MKSSKVDFVRKKCKLMIGMAMLMLMILSAPAARCMAGSTSTDVPVTYKATGDMEKSQNSENQGKPENTEKYGGKKRAVKTGDHMQLWLMISCLCSLVIIITKKVTYGGKEHEK